MRSWSRQASASWPSSSGETAGGSEPRLHGGGERVDPLPQWPGSTCSSLASAVSVVFAPSASPWVAATRSPIAIVTASSSVSSSGGSAAPASSR